MDRTVQQDPTRSAASSPAAGKDAVSPRTQAVTRVLKRLAYKDQTALLGAGRAPRLGPGEEMGVARAGFEAPGSGLPHQSHMEQAFGRPLGHVRAHVGAPAKEAADAMGAEAYTLGTDIAFRDARPTRDTVAHEVAHVVQQTSGTGGGGSEASLERDAERSAQAVVSGQKAEPVGRSGAGVRKKEKLPSKEEGFNQMWAAHPHNYQENESENTSSEQILEEAGFPSDWNTCAIRMSIMLNTLGLKITPAKTKQAGIQRSPTYSRKTKQYYIISAAEMWTYLQKNFRQEDVSFPKQGRYKDGEAFQKGFEAEIKEIVKGRKGIVAFDKIFGYGGTGHMDLFDGEKLSDAPEWYPCQKIRLWYIAVP